MVVAVFCFWAGRIQVTVTVAASVFALCRILVKHGSGGLYGGREAVIGGLNCQHIVQSQMFYQKGFQRGLQRPRMEWRFPEPECKVQDDVRVRTRDEPGLSGQV